MEKTKVAIIGGGPAGLTAGIYAARAGLNPVIFAGSPPGGQLVLTSEVENFPGFKSILGPELVQRIREQAVSFGAKVIDENVKEVDFKGRTFKLFYKGEALEAEAVILAVGARARWLGLPSEQRLIGKGVSACATCDGFFFKDKIVAVVGGGDTAMEEALVLTKFAKKVYIIHRRDKFRASKVMQDRVFSNPKIEVIWNAQVKEVLGREKVEGVKLEIKIPNSKHQGPNKFQIPSTKFQTLEEKEFGDWSLVIGILPLDGLFIAIGHRPDTEIFQGQIELDEKGYVITSGRVMEEYTKFKVKNSKLKVAVQSSKLEEFVRRFDLDYRHMTSVPGVFAAGDCVDFVYRQAITAAGMGAQAAIELERWLETVKSSKLKVQS